MVIMDEKDYISKAVRLLQHTSTYRQLTVDHTNKQKAKLITLLWKIKTESRMDDNTCRNMFGTEACSPKYCGLPNVHKKTPLLDQ